MSMILFLEGLVYKSLLDFLGKCEVNYWKSLHKRAKEREEKLKKELQKKEGKIRDLTKRLFGKSNEKSNSGKNEGGLKLGCPKDNILI